MDPKKICSLKIIPPKTNLNKISIKTNLGRRREKSYPRDGRFSIMYDRDEETDIKIIGQGANGIAFLVSWYPKEQKSIVFKYPITEPGFEVNAVENILGNYHHFVIPHKVIHDQYGNPFVIMQEANGDVYSLLKNKVSNRFRNKIIQHYVSAIGNLWNRKGIVFTDMKTENLLYKCQKDGISFYFGDIGAFSKKNLEEYDYEVEPPECEGRIDKNFCLFTIGLLIISIYNFRYERPGDDRSSYENKFYRPLKEQIDKHIGNKTINRITKKLLCWDPTFRNETPVKSVVSEILK